MPLYVSFFIASNRKLNLEGSCAFRGCRPEGPKYGKEAYFGYSGRHQVHMNLQPFPLSPQVATPGKVSAAGAAKCMCFIAFLFVLIKLLNKLISKKQ
jgi:hypothetical protein